jgi:hypothetical protein
MYRARFAFIPIVISIVILTSSSLLFAQTWISASGSDTNSCTYAYPCRTLAGALAKTSAGGRINMIGSGEFGPGPVTITQAVTIDGGGGLASILASSSGANGITVSAGASDIVILRGLRIEGVYTGQTGVDFQSGGSLFVEDCSISSFTVYGISFEPNLSNQLFISNTTIENINPGSTSSAGIYFSATGKVKSAVTVNKTRVEGCGTGLLAKSAGLKALVSDSIISGNTAHGISVQGSSLVSTERCILANNGKAGITVNSSGATVIINNDTIVNSGYGLLYGSAGGSIISTKTNAITQNTNNTAVPSGTVALE